MEDIVSDWLPLWQGAVLCHEIQSYVAPLRYVRLLSSAILIIFVVLLKWPLRQHYGKNIIKYFHKKRKNKFKHYLGLFKVFSKLNLSLQTSDFIYERVTRFNPTISVEALVYLHPLMTFYVVFAYNDCSAIIMS